MDSNIFNRETYWTSSLSKEVFIKTSGCVTQNWNCSLVQQKETQHGRLAVTVETFLILNILSVGR